MIPRFGIVHLPPGLEWSCIDGGLGGAEVSRIEEEFWPGPELTLCHTVWPTSGVRQPPRLWSGPWPLSTPRSLAAGLKEGPLLGAPTPHLRDGAPRQSLGRDQEAPRRRD